MKYDGEFSMAHYRLPHLDLSTGIHLSMGNVSIQKRGEFYSSEVMDLPANITLPTKMRRGLQAGMPALPGVLPEQHQDQF